MGRQVNSITGLIRSTPLYGLIAGWLASTFLLGIVGPFGTYDTVPILTRMLHWASIVGLGIVVFIHTLRFSGRVLRMSRDMSFLSASLTLGLVLSPMIWVLYGSGYFALSTPSTPSMFENLLAVLCIALAVFLMLAEPPSNLPPEEETLANPSADANASTVAVPFLSRIEPELGLELLRVCADNHHVLVETRLGQSRVLLRFSDALRELEGYDGLRVHRSHWVSRRAVRAIRSQGARHYLILESGIEVPVSAAYREAVEELQTGLAPA